MQETHLELMLKGHGLVTAEILYHMPDYHALLQSFVWQEYDTAPDFPKLYGFLDFWEKQLDGPVHSVRYCHCQLIKPGEWQKVDGEIALH